MTWSIGVTESPGRRLVITDILTAQLAWKRLSKPARAAVEAAYPDGVVTCHIRTQNALEAHGFIDGLPGFDYHLTEPGKAVAKWCVKP